MVRIRFRRVGAKGQASFRIVAADKESPRDGRFLEVLGHYNPRTEPSTVRVNEARLFHWMEHGAQPSDSVVRALRSLGTWDRWERYKGGESLDTLLEEAEAAQPEVDPRTRRDDLVGKRRVKRAAAAKKEAEPAAVAEPEEEAKPEAPAEAEADEEAAPEAEAPAEAEADEEAAPEGEAPVEAAAEAEAPAEAEAEEGAEAEAEAEKES